MSKPTGDSLSVGFVIGVLAPVLGFFVYGLFWAQDNNRSLGYFINDLFLGTPEFRSSIIALSLIANLIPFYVFLRKERYKTARGVLLAVFLYVPFVIYFWLNS